MHAPLFYLHILSVPRLASDCLSLRASLGEQEPMLPSSGRPAALFAAAAAGFIIPGFPAKQLPIRVPSAGTQARQSCRQYQVRPPEAPAALLSSAAGREWRRDAGDGPGSEGGGGSERREQHNVRLGSEPAGPHPSGCLSFTALHPTAIDITIHFSDFNGNAFALIFRPARP